MIYSNYPGEASQIWDNPVIRALLALSVAVTVMAAVHLSFLAAAICVTSFGVVGWLGTKCVCKVKID
jgi:hypothetical protein